MRQSAAHVTSLQRIGSTLVARVLGSPTLAITVWLLALVLLAGAMFVAPATMTFGLSVLQLGGLLLWLLWRRPEFSPIILIFLTSSFFQSDIVDIRLPIGGLDLRDLLFISMLGLVMVKRISSGDLTLPWHVISVPLLVFLGLGLGSAFYALLYLGAASNWIFGELRHIMYYASFFLVAWSIRQPRQLIPLLIGLFVLADLTATIVLIQQFFGANNPVLALLGTDKWAVNKVGDGSFGAVRVIPPGHVLMFMMMVIAFCLMLLKQQSPRLRAVLIFQFVYLNIGLLLTYTRAQWLAAAIALGLLGCVMPPPDRMQLMRYLCVAMLVVMATYGVFRTELRAITRDLPFVASLTDRLLSIFRPEETFETYSLEWRVYETGVALESVAQHPILGVGLGNVYRAPTLLHDESSRVGKGFRLTRFVHNSYLYLAVKMGLPGLIAFGWFYLTFLINSWRASRAFAHHAYQRIGLSIVASSVGLVSWSITEPHFLLYQSTAVIGIMAGIVVCMRRIERVATGSTY